MRQSRIGLESDNKYLSRAIAKGSTFVHVIRVLLAFTRCTGFKKDLQTALQVTIECLCDPVVDNSDLTPSRGVMEALEEIWLAATACVCLDTGRVFAVNGFDGVNELSR